MERLEIPLEKLFDSIRQTVENLGNYESYSEILTIPSHQKEEFVETISEAIEIFLNKELDEEISDEVIDFVDDDVFLLDDDDDDEDDEDDYDNR